MAMVTSHSQYLNHDLLCPNMTAPIDKDKSPLSLLERTCEMIGLPDTPPKTKGADKATTKKDGASGGGGKQSAAKSTSDGARSPVCAASDRPASSASNHSSDGARKTKEQSTAADNPSDPRPTSVSSSAASTAGTTSSGHAPVATTTPAVSRCATGSYPPFPFGLAHMQFGANGAAAYPHGFPALPIGSPYVNPFLAGAFGSLSPSMSRLCTDPLCKSCPPSAGSMHGRACPVGCVQCTHSADLSAMWLNSYSSMLHGFPGAALPPSLAALSATSGAANGLQSLLGAANGGQHVCNWVDATKGLCLSSFGTPEELMSHMRTHATQDQSKPTATPALSVAAATGLLGLAGPTATMAGHMGGGRMSPRSAYMAALRFHPYGKLPGAPPTSITPHLPISPASYSALSAIYGQRLPGSLPHP